MVIRSRPGAPTVHVHFVPLKVSRHDLHACERLLDTRERQRAGRFRYASLRQRWVVGRAHLRQVLAGHLGAAPGELAIRHGRNGKPVLDENWPRLHFNLSHSEGHALIAVSDAAEVGIDLEYERELSSWHAVAERVFAHHELQQILSAPPCKRQHLFYCCWTRKEAVIKATGEGLSADLKRFVVSVDDEASMLACDDGDASEWHLRHFEPTRNYVGALALRFPVAPKLIVHRGDVSDLADRYRRRAVA